MAETSSIDEVLARSDCEHAIAPDEIEVEAGHAPDPVAVALLRESIPRVGLINPIVVWKRSIGDYVLIAGRNRLEALKELGASAVPCSVTDERPSNLVRVDENFARRHLTGRQQAELRRIREELIATRSSEGKSSRAIAEELGVSKSSVADLQVATVGQVKVGRDGKTYSGRSTPDEVDARRQRVLALKREGLTHEQVAERLGVKLATVGADIAKIREAGVEVPNTRTLVGVDPEAVQIAALRSAWAAASESVRGRFLAEVTAAPVGAT